MLGFERGMYIYVRVIFTDHISNHISHKARVLFGI